MNQQLVLKRLSMLVIFVGPIVSIVVSPTFNYDPINLIKILVTTTVAFYFLGIFVTNFKYFYSRLSVKFWFISLFFIVSLISTFLFSGAPKNQQFWGSFGRNTGFLTYFSLLLILIGTSLIQRQSVYRSIINSLVVTSVIVEAYCLIQIAGVDPVTWSLKDTFATFGNTNFLSAFLGIACLASLVLVFDNEKSKLLRFGLVSISILGGFIILDTGSIQGILILIAGIVVLGYFLIRSNSRIRFILIPYFISSLGLFSLTFMGVVNKGPLASFIFQPSILFRADYWHAGWIMTISHPFFGVGLDSYGDWYREVRGSISTLRTGPDRTSNTAHNIFLDLSSTGGFPLIILYLAIISYACTVAFRWLKNNKQFDPYFVAIFSCFVAYQIQAVVSINQIGVGIWGWLLNGSLIGYCLTTKNDTLDSFKKKIRKRAVNSLPASTSAMALISSIVGFIMAFIPLNADSKYRTALLSKELNKMMESLNSPGSTAWHLNETLDAAIMNNFSDQARLLDQKLISSYPRDFYGWKIRYVLNNSSAEEKAVALQKIRELDPFNPDIPKS